VCAGLVVVMVVIQREPTVKPNQTKININHFRSARFANSISDTDFMSPPHSSRTDVVVHERYHGTDRLVANKNNNMMMVMI
jgi:hypothetical protein